MKRSLFFAVGFLLGISMLLAIRLIQPKPEVKLEPIQLHQASAKAGKIRQQLNTIPWSHTKTRIKVLECLSPKDISAVLAEYQTRVGFYGLDTSEQMQFEELVKTWHAKSPDEALAWIRTLPDFSRETLLEEIVPANDH